MRDGATVRRSARDRPAGPGDARQRSRDGATPSAAARDRASPGERRRGGRQGRRLDRAGPHDDVARSISASAARWGRWGLPHAWGLRVGAGLDAPRGLEQRENHQPERGREAHTGAEENWTRSDRRRSGGDTTSSWARRSTSARAVRWRRGALVGARNCWSATSRRLLVGARPLARAVRRRGGKHRSGTITRDILTLVKTEGLF